MIRMRRLFFLLVIPVFLLAGRCDASQGAIDRFFSAIQKNDFAAATDCLNQSLKSNLTPQSLEKLWRDGYDKDGPLKSWQVLHSDQIPGGVEATVKLSFAMTDATAKIAVATESDRIASLYFKPAQSSAPATSPPYADAARFHSLDVVVDSPPVHLPGTITIPNGKGPFPAVLLVHGSGTHDRDETVGPNHIFKDIAEGLSSRGILVLRYDKRSFMHSTRMTTVDAEVTDDAAAAIDMLRARSDVARDRIYIVGHSLGAELAPDIAKRAWPVAGIIMLAPPGRKLEQVIVQQMRFLKETSPTDMMKVEEQASRISKHQMHPDESMMGAPASYFYDIDNRNEVALARTLDVPILILHGTRDYQITEDNIRVWQKGLKGDAKVKIEELPDLNHLFIKGHGTPDPAEYQIPGHVDESVIDLISNFIESR